MISSMVLTIGLLAVVGMFPGYGQSPMRGG